MNFLGLDVGTSAIKAIVVDANEAVLASATAALSTSRPRPLWSEQDPDAWWQGACQAAKELRMTAPDAWREIGAVGLSGQMHGPVLLDSSGRVIRQAILWNDGRAEAEAQGLEATVPNIGAIAGVKPMAGFAAPKLLWLRRHEPKAFARIAMVLMPKDYVRWRMTGEFATDMCDASGTLWLDVAKRCWSTPIVEASGLKISQLPRLLEGSEISGRLLPQIARDWDLAPGTPVATGAGDAAAGAIGIGAVSDGDAFISLGTSAQYFVARSQYVPAPDKLIHAFCHGLPRRWFQMAALLNGASCLTWAADLLGSTDISALVQEAEAGFSGPSELTFLPYLSGERTPLNDPHARAMLYGLTAGSNRAQIILAVLEGVALALADCQDALEQAGTTVGSLGVIGGGSRSRFWMRLVAAILQKPLILYRGGEIGPAFGAARLARLSVTGETAETLCTHPEIAERIEPDEVLSKAYGGRFAQFRALYRAVAPTFGRSQSGQGRPTL